jgi:hypothetical protein
LPGLWRVENKGLSGTMEFNSDSTLIMEMQGYKALGTYHLKSSKGENILEMRNTNNDSLSITLLTINKESHDSIDLTIIKTIFYDEKMKPYLVDTSHNDYLIPMKRIK